MKQLILFTTLFSVTFFIKSATYTVINTSNSGSGSLRQAMANCLSNAASAPHSIIFNIPVTDIGYNPQTGVWTIVVIEELPSLNTGYITIDGTSQTINQGNTNPMGPEICINGNSNNVEFCFSIQNASNITIKGFIINEFLYGIQIYGTSSHHNIISGNYLGCNHNGTERMGNYNALEIISGANQNQVGGRNPEDKNLVSGNEYAGIRISDASYNIVINNWVGVDRTGSHELHNYDGITIEGASEGNQIGGDSLCERNVTSGNVAYGIDIFGVGCANNKIQGNFIGTDVTGSYAIPNTYGLLFDDRSHQNLVGGYNPGEGNLISGNTAFGAYCYNNGTNTNYIIGNKIGTDFTGTFAVANETGLHIDGCTYANFVDSNLISGNLANGITLFATYTDYNTIIRNKIGTDITGTLPLGNGIQGILITQGSAHNTIGGSPENANIIAFNGANGIKIESENSDHNLISCNSIHSNGNYGIELYPNYGFNENDPGDGDTGPNDLLNCPVILNVSYYGSIATISGLIDVANPANTKIEIYRALQNQNYASEGKDYIGSTNCNSLGYWSFSFSISDTTNYYTALAIDPDNNTSEFSKEYPQQPDLTYTKILSTDYSSFSIWPNPVRTGENLFVRLSDLKLPQLLVIYNNVGKIIHRQEIYDNKNCMVDTSLPKGIYFISVVCKNGCLATNKLIITN